MANTFKFGNGQWAVGKETALAYNDENSNFKPLPFSFDRGSIATVVNKDGLIETVGVDEPRIDFLNNTKGHLLLEPSRTNLLTYSEDFSSGWVLDDATIISNNAISPDGALNATLLKGNTNSSRHNLVISGQASSTGSFSVFVKAKELKYLQIASANTTQQYVNFDLSNGIIGTVGSAFSNAKLENYGNGWYRCIVVSANQFNAFYVSLVSGLNATWLESWVMPNNTDGLYIFGAQLEAGSYPTSYIPTSGQSGGVTRSADVCNNGGNEQVINSTEGVLYAEIAALADDLSSRIISLSDGTDTNRVNLFYFSQSNDLAVNYRVSGSTVVSFIADLTDITNFSKVAFKWESGNFKMYVDGALIDEDTNTTMLPSDTLDVLSFSRGDGSFGFYGNVKDVRVYNTALTDQELQNLTS